MTRRMGIRELRDTLTATIRRVRAGETIEVTHDGTPVAVLSPFGRDPLDELLASGAATPAVPLTALLRRFPPVAGPATEALEDDRAER